MNLIRTSAAIVCAVSATPCLASTEPVEATVASSSLTSLQEGSTRVGGGFDFSWNELSGPTLSLNPSYEYFVSDRLSLGGTLSFAHTFSDLGFSYWAIGPSATYYFWKEQRFAAFLGESLSYGRLTLPGEFSHSTVVSTTKLGVEYFFLRNVSFSPSLQWKHAFDADYLGGPLPSRNDFSLTGQFSIYF